MADLKDISIIKNKIISSLLENDDIFECLKNNDDSIEEPSDLIYKNVMPYFYNLGVEKKQKTYIFMRIYAPRLNERVIEQFILDIGIGCHKNLMNYKGVTRIDYLMPIINNIIQSYNNKQEMIFPLNNFYKIGIDKVKLRNINPLSLYDADYDGYILSYTIDMLDTDRCKNEV